MTDGGRVLGANYWKKVAGRGEREVGKAFRDVLACPDDDAPLDQNHDKPNAFVCPACDRKYEIENGYLSILPSNDQYMLDEEERKRLNALARETYSGLDHPEDHFPDHWPQVEEILGDLSGKKVLDVCCGSGWAASWFARQDADVAAGDIATGKGGLETAGEIRTRIDKDFDLFQFDACRLPFIPETFDIVFLSRTLYRLSRPERILLEVERVLKPDGIVINLGEPIGRTGVSAGIDGRDPRLEGRGLSLSDYAAMYQEVGLKFESFSPGEQRNGKSGLFDRIKRHLKSRSSREIRLFVAHKPKKIDLSSVRIPFPKKGRKEEDE